MPALSRLVDVPRAVVGGALARWPARAARRSRVDALEREVAALRTAVEQAEEVLVEVEKGHGLLPSLLGLEWAAHRGGITPAPRPDDERTAAACGLTVVDRPAELEVLVFHGEVGALLAVTTAERPPLLLRDPGGWLKPTSSGTIDPLPDGLDAFFAGVEAFSLVRREPVLRVLAARTADGLGFVGVAPPEEPRPRYTSRVDRLLGKRAEFARARLRRQRAREDA